jgi:hypothetical protein
LPVHHQPPLLVLEVHQLELIWLQTDHILQELQSSTVGITTPPHSVFNVLQDMLHQLQAVSLAHQIVTPVHQIQHVPHVPQLIFYKQTEHALSKTAPTLPLTEPVFTQRT